MLGGAEEAVMRLRDVVQKEFEGFSRTDNPWKSCTSLERGDVEWDTFFQLYVRHTACEIQAPNEKYVSTFRHVTINVIRTAEYNWKKTHNLILWQYWADKNGFLTIYPAVRRQKNHDPRTRSWFRQAASTAGKSVIILLDRSRSMTNVLYLAKRVATSLLELLNPKDKVGVVHFF
ncbi:voltage-dependent calcium channel subunit alpha-2/delta-3-like [Tachypleus tridentatus]|uniref:voltage-dependent calcium channel subunit alpha-2/delta-3-like n=1 Tax=Tachypleus tridentatus TaxID=6853 RepID=UPI003FD40A20